MARAKARSTKSTPKKDWRDVFVEALGDVPNVTAAAQVAGVHRTTAYKERDANEGFAAAWDDALEQSTDNLVGEAYRRAFSGVEKPVFGSLGSGQGSGEIGRVREYSDTLAIFLLKSHRPATYRERQEVDLNVGFTNDDFNKAKDKAQRFESERFGED